MGFLKSIFGETTEEKTERWKTELQELLEEKLKEVGIKNEEYAFGKVDSTLELCVGGTIYLQIGFFFTDEDSEETSHDLVKITGPLVYLPDKNILPFYRKLLDLNGELYGTLCTQDEIVCLSRVMAIESLTKIEVGVAVVGILAEVEELTPLLIEEFQVQRFVPY